MKRLRPDSEMSRAAFDYVARAGDDGTTEHVTVVRSRNAITGFTTTVAYDKAVLLEERVDGTARIDPVVLAELRRQT